MADDLGGWQHWIHLRTTNPIESTFATVRHRTKLTRGPGSRAAGFARYVDRPIIRRSEQDVASVEEPGRRALILLDFQRDFLAEDGRMPVARHHVTPVLAAARHAADQAQRRGDLIVKVGNEFRRGDPVGNLIRRWAAVAGSAGAAWDNRIDPDGVLYLPKSASSAFSNPALGAALDAHNVQHLTLAGLFAKGCVRATAVAGLRRGLTVQVLADAVACSSDRSRDRALARLAAHGAKVTAVGGAAADGRSAGEI